MSINPAQGISPTDKEPVDPGQLPSRPAQMPASAQPNLGTSPKPEANYPPKTDASSELPQDEVQVQRDSETNGEIVIKYLDQFGQVVLQVPSAQVLGVARAIDQELEQEAKARANAGVAESEGGTNHGH